MQWLPPVEEVTVIMVPYALAEPKTVPMSAQTKEETVVMAGTEVVHQMKNAFLVCKLLVKFLKIYLTDTTVLWIHVVLNVLLTIQGNLRAFHR